MPTERRTTVQVAVVLLTLDQREATLRCLSSFDHVAAPPYRIVLWDNGSEDRTAETVRERFPDILVHRHPSNLGVASGRNAAAELAIETFAPPYLLFLDNDMEVTQDLLSALLEPFSADPRLAQTTAKIATLGEHQRLYGAGGCFIRFWRGETGHVGHGEIDRGQYDAARRCLPSGGCMMVRSEVFEELGGFDAAFDPYGPEDLDFGLRARKAGYHGLYLPAALVFHESSPGHTFGGGMRSRAYVENKMRLWLVFLRRHGSPLQKLAFFLLGGPVSLARLVVREGRRGNLTAIKGLVRGLIEHLRSEPGGRA